ncbi:MAG: FtsW/RodA/SpoVE family cell cycle protein, partial [Clostridia bacterium]|nr:FtsW/RodA/SpoVE family cell cycle protein [Clostridia bacterium]
MNKENKESALFRYLKNTDYMLWLIIGVIAFYSLILLKSVSRATYTDYYKTQLLAVILGMAGAIFVSIIGYERIAGYWYLVAAGSAFLMIYTIFFGINISSVGGVNATAWIRLGGRTFQPSELVKIGFIVTYAKHLSILVEKGTVNKFSNLILLLCHAGIPFMLCHLQGDDGAGVVF